MRISLQIPFFNWAGGAPVYGETLKKIVQKAEAGGFYSIWVMDHFYQMEWGSNKAQDPMLEAYSTLGYIAALTQRVKLGVLVTGVIYRYPGILTKTATTVDVLSGGRMYCGIGAAWYEREAKGLGVPFPPMGERFEQLEETLQIIKQMWSDNDGAYNGKHFQLAETICVPQPVSKPHPPIMVGGSGEKKTLRFVAEYGDACNFDTGMGIEGVRHKLAVLKGHCDDVKRDYNAIERTVIHHAANPADTQKLIDFCGALAKEGIQHVIFNMHDIETLAPLDHFIETIIPATANF
ncbi:MAG: LLM class F420-dependent oxidoreductase [bacterium]|nr:LLM class F420-dependent oxidoreductase [bacterium]